ncbi:MAG: hypothetical protein KDA33_06085, partial [Phycisphaerales bacterium]|nr:hypothetical protein [Phycisphaerales bacterium]
EEDHEEEGVEEALGQASRCIAPRSVICRSSSILAAGVWRTIVRRGRLISYHDSVFAFGVAIE